jgi:hypothetical protein
MEAERFVYGTHKPSTLGVVMSKANTIKQVFELLMERKAWWLVPMVVVFILIGALIVTTQGSALSPFIYALF